MVLVAAAKLKYCPVQEKKYTKDHEWVDLSEDGTIGGSSKNLQNPMIFVGSLFVGTPVANEENTYMHNITKLQLGI